MELTHVSIPDGDSFLREGKYCTSLKTEVGVSIPDGDSFLREVQYGDPFVSIGIKFQSPMGIVSSAK